MIKQLRIQNFQSHEKSELEFSDGVNIIVGQSDSGKSAIIRSLRWACWNKPSGNSFCSTWGRETSVELTTEEGSIIRSKGKKDKYVLRRPNGGETLFEAFGTNVPDEIITLLSLDEINLQYQLDSPFLLSLTPGQVAQHFNSIAKLDQIDRGLFNINKAIRELESQSKYKQTDLKSKEIELDKYKHLEKFETEIEVLEQMQNQLRSFQSSKQILDLKIYDYKQADLFITQHKVLLADENKVDDLLTLIEKKNKLIEEQQKLIRSTRELSSIAQKIKQEQEYIQDEPLVTTLLTQYKTLKPLNEAFSSLSKLIKRISYITNLIKEQHTNLTLSESKFHKLMPDICPLCGNSTKKTDVMEPITLLQRQLDIWISALKHSEVSLNIGDISKETHELHKLNLEPKIILYNKAIDILKTQLKRERKNGKEQNYKTS